MQSDTSRPFHRFDRWLASLPVLGVGLLVALAGWPHSPATREGLVILLRVFAGLYGALTIVSWIVGPRRSSKWWQKVFAIVVAGLILLSAVFELSLERWLSDHFASFGLHGWLLMIVAAQQVGALLVHLRELQPLIERHFIERFSPALLLVGTFSGLIAGGTLLLKMPNCTRASISWLDAFFTSTSAVCVTGLVVTDTGSTFTSLGQVILLGLIQVGGFGIVILTFFLALLAGQGLSISSRVLLRDLLSEENLRTLGSTLGAVFGLSLLFELAGAALLFGFWKEALGPGQPPVWFSLFHSVSAFCNAGFSLFPEGLMDPAAASHRVQGTIMSLIVLGGIGFPVHLELLRRLRRRLHRKEPRLRRLSLHSRLTLLTTATLIVAGTLLLWAAGHNGLWESAFNAITARTAGFNIGRMADLTPAAIAVMIFLMFIGGSPGGIAGGIKTTTFAVAILNLRRILLGRRDVSLGGRRLDESVCHRAFAIILLSLLWISVAAVLLLYLQPEIPLLDALFETVSAFATVGLSRDLTATLQPLPKLVILLTMFVGRVGILNFFFSFLAGQAQDQRVRYPAERIIID